MRSHIRRLLESAGFSPRQLFAALQGAWLEPKQGLIWQGNTGVTPTTTGGQTIGLMLDQSQGAVLGPELVTNGGFDSGTGWTLGQSGSSTATINSGALTLGVAAGAVAYAFRSDTSLAANKTYRITINVTSVIGAGSIAICAGAANNITTPVPPEITSSGTFEFNFCVQDAISSLGIKRVALSGNYTFVIDSISVREILGNHAYQATANQRPLLGRRYNLLTYSEDFSNGAWTRIALGSGSLPTLTANYAAAPDGTMTAARLQLNSGGDAYGDISAFSQAGLATTQDVTQTWWMKSTDSNNYTVNIVSVLAAGFDSITNVTVTPVWTKFTATSGPTIGTIRIRLRGGTGSSQAADILIWHPDLRLTADVGKDPAYQRITTATDYDVGQYPAAVHDTTDSLTVSLPSINVRRNLLTNSVWAGAVAGNPGTAPTGFTFAFATASLTSISYGADGSAQLTLTANDQRWVVFVGYTAAQNTSYTHSLTVVSNPNSVNIASFLGYTGNPAGSTITRTVNGVSVSSSYVPIAGDRIAFTLAVATTVGSVAFRFGFGAAGNITGTVTITQPQLELGSVATPYQKITDWTSEAYSSNGSVYFSTPVGMSSLHNQSMATTYTLPALSSDIYSWMVFPQRLSAVNESRLERYMLRLSGLAGADYFEQVDYGPELVTTTSFTGVPIGGPAFTNYDTGAARVIGRSYLIAFTISGYSGTGTVGISGGAGTSWVGNPAFVSANGTYSYTLTALVVSNVMFFTRSTNTCNFSNISVRELKDGITGQLTADDSVELLLAQ